VHGDHKLAGREVAKAIDERVDGFFAAGAARQIVLGIFRIGSAFLDLSS
jgi:hypothetical protein